jgi:hypothetical protein
MPHSEKMLLDLYLKVLFDSFLTEALGQDLPPPPHPAAAGSARQPGLELDCFLAMAFKIGSSTRYGLSAPVLKRINM